MADAARATPSTADGSAVSGDATGAPVADSAAVAEPRRLRTHGLERSAREAAEEAAAFVDPAVFEANKDATEGVCAELNDEDPALVLALATELWRGARSAKMTALYADKACFAAYGSDSPVRQELVMPLVPPVASGAEAKARFAAARERALGPSVDAALAGALAAVALPLFGAAYTDWRAFGFMRAMAVTIFGDARAALALDVLCRVTVAVHAIEAGLASSRARSLGLGPATVAGWVGLTFAFGMGALGKLRRFAKAETLPGMAGCALFFPDDPAEAAAAAPPAPAKEPAITTASVEPTTPPTPDEPAAASTSVE